MYIPNFEQSGINEIKLPAKTPFCKDCKFFDSYGECEHPTIVSITQHINPVSGEKFYRYVYDNALIRDNCSEQRKLANVNGKCGPAGKLFVKKGWFMKFVDFFDMGKRPRYYTKSE